MQKKTVNYWNYGLVQFNPYIGPLSGATTPARVDQSPSITGTSPSDCLVSYQDTRWWGSYPSTKKLTGQDTFLKLLIHSYAH